MTHSTPGCGTVLEREPKMAAVWEGGFERELHKEVWAAFLLEVGEGAGRVLAHPRVTTEQAHAALMFHSMQCSANRSSWSGQSNALALTCI